MIVKTLLFISPVFCYFTCDETFTIYDTFECDPVSDNEAEIGKFNYANKLELTINYKNYSRKSSNESPRIRTFHTKRN
jgi:hypothetical protein